MTKQETLTQLITDIQLPISPEDTSLMIEKTPEEEFDKLIADYTFIKDYKVKIETAALVADAEAVGKAQADKQNKLATMDKGTTEVEETNQKEYDDAMDMLDIETESRIDTILSKQNLDIMRAEELGSRQSISAPPTS